MEYITKIKSGRTGAETNTLIRNQRIELRASPEEYFAIESFAIQNGYKTLAHYVRETAVEGPPFQGTKKSRLKEYKKNLVNLNMIGSNLNQAVRILNQNVLKKLDNEPMELLAQFQMANLVEMKEQIKILKKSLVKYSK